MDKAKYDYIRSDLHPSIYWEVEKGMTVDPNNVEYRSNVRDAVMRLAKRNPGWMLVISDNYHRGSNKRYCTKVVVYEKDEPLGRFWYGYNYSRSSAELNIDCRALSRTRQRGSSTKTTDVNKAIKIIEANFAPMSLKEIANNKKAEARSNIHTSLIGKQNAYRKLSDAVTPSVMQFAVDNYDAIKHQLSIPEQQFADFVTAKEDFNATLSMRDVAEGKGGITLAITDDKYVSINQTGSDGEPVVYTSDTLPVEYRAKLGMLKLVEPGNLITDVGARVTGDIYVILNDK